MEDKKIPEILADLPEDWGYGQIVAPEGESVGLTPQHGYNYLMKKVNAAVRLINQIYEDMGQTVPEDMVTANGGGALILPAVLGVGPYEIEFTEEETAEYALKEDLSQYAPLENPLFSKNIMIGPHAAGAAGVDISETLSGAIIAGYNHIVTGRNSMTSGYENQNESMFSLVVGRKNSAYNQTASCIGEGIESRGNCSLGVGYGTIACYLELVAGKYNVTSTQASMYEGNIFIIGIGDSDTSRTNAFRISKNGEIYGAGPFNSSGADYAEIYEWLDGNPDAEDRVGRFVVLDGERIRLAGPEDSVLDVLGIVSGNPSIVGDSHDDQWRNMYLRDVFGRLLYEDVEVEDPEHPGEMIVERRRKLNPAYDPAQTYIPQSRRPEKSAVGLLGKLVLIDDGSCEIDGWCAPGESGVAVRSEARTRFRVMSRLDDKHIRVNIMVQ